MKNLILLIATFAVIISCKEKPKETKESGTELVEIDKIETDNEWTTLFDGSSFNGWHFYGDGEITDSWKIDDGAMVFYPPKERSRKIYDIVTDKSFTNFVLSLEWKISENGNSGIFWGIHEDEKYKPYETGPEIQVLDNQGHPDAKNGTSHQAGALYDMISPSEDATKPVGEWNTCVITINHMTNEGNAVLNGVEVVKFPVHGELWDKMVANSKFAIWKDFGKYKNGKIGLQDHGDIVSYRNIKIKEL